MTSVFWVAEILVLVFTTVTGASGRTALVESVTVPLIDAVVACACGRAVLNRRHFSSPSVGRRSERDHLICFPKRPLPRPEQTSPNASPNTPIRGRLSRTCDLAEKSCSSLGCEGYGVTTAV